MTDVPSIEKRAELITKLRTTMEICTVLRDAAGKGMVEALTAKGYGIIGDSTREDPLGDGQVREDTIRQSEEETVLAIAGPFYMRGDIVRTLAWAQMNGMQVMECPTEEFKDGLAATEPVPVALRERFGENADSKARLEKLSAILQKLKALAGGNLDNLGNPSNSDCNTAGKLSIHAHLPDAEVEVELCMACAERYIAGDEDALDIMDEPLVRRAILAAFIAQHPNAKLPNAKLDVTSFSGQNAPSTSTKQ